MARQVKITKDIKAPSIKDKAKIVSEVPTGPEWEKVMVDGEEVYRKSSSVSTPKSESSGIKRDVVKAPMVKKAGISTPSKTDTIRRKITPPTVNPIEEYVRVVKPTTPVVQKPQYLRSEMQEIFPGGLEKGYKSYMVPDLETGGGYGKQKNIITDVEGMPVKYDFNKNQYIRTGEPTIHQSMPVQNETPTIQAPLKPNELQTKFGNTPVRLNTKAYNAAIQKDAIVNPEVPVEYKGFNQLDTTPVNKSNIQFLEEQNKNLAVPKLKKGGVVGQVRGYEDGGVIGQNDPYAQQKAEEEKKAKQAKNEANARGVANAAGSALGGYGSGYYASTPTYSEGEATRGAALGAVSKAGPIGGVVGGIAAIGDKIGAPIKARSEKIDPTTGELTDESRTKRNAALGIALSPSKRLTYKGGLTDVSGKAYLQSIEEKTKGQLADVQAANVASQQQQAIAARDAGDFNAKITTPYDLSGATFDENKQLILSGDQQFDKNRPMKKGGVVQMCAEGGLTKMKAREILHDGTVHGKPITDKQRRFFGYKGYSEGKADGGEIKGGGGPKEDKINAKVEGGSFVVPAKNAKVAIELRAKVLGKPPKAKANLNQGNGAKVKLSNGEHLFTPEEKEELLEKGVNVNLLAPNAEHKEEMMEHKSEHNMKEEEMEKKSHIMFPAMVGLKDGGLVKGVKVDGVTWNGKNWVDESGNKYTEESGKKFTDKYTKSVEKAKAGELSRLNTEIGVYTRKLEEAKSSGNDKAAAGLQSKIDELKGTKEKVPEIIEKASIKAPSVSKAAKQTNTYTLPEVVDRGEGDNVVVPTAPVTQTETERKAIADAAELNRSALATGITPESMASYSQKPAPKKRSGIADYLGNIDPTMFLGAGQAALGLNMIGKEKRPIDKSVIDPTYTANVNRAQQEAQFGFTPENRALLEQQQQNALNDARFSARNFAGGSAGTAFNQERAAINQGWTNALNLRSADQDLRMEKARYADQQVKERANFLDSQRRRAFGDAMDTFQQRQQAGSELIGAGIRNTIGAYRYGKELSAQEEAERQANAYKQTI